MNKKTENLTLRPLVLVVVIMGMISFVAPMAPGQSREDRREQRRQEQLTRAQERMFQNIQEALGCSDEVWQVLQPRIESIMMLQAEVDSANSNVAALAGRRARPTLVGTSVNPGSKVVVAAQHLDQALSDPSTNPDQLRVALNAAREARAEATLRLRQAHREFIQLLTVRQEAVLFQMGLIE